MSNARENVFALNSVVTVDQFGAVADSNGTAGSGSTYTINWSLTRVM